MRVWGTFQSHSGALQQSGPHIFSIEHPIAIILAESDCPHRLKYTEGERMRLAARLEVCVSCRLSPRQTLPAVMKSTLLVFSSVETRPVARSVRVARMLCYNQELATRKDTVTLISDLAHCIERWNKTPRPVPRCTPWLTTRFALHLVPALLSFVASNLGHGSRQVSSHEIGRDVDDEYVRYRVRASRRDILRVSGCRKSQGRSR